MFELSKLIEIAKIADAETSAGTEVTSDSVDLANYQGGIFFCTIATANAGNYLALDQGTTSSPTEAIASSGVVATVNGQVVCVTLHKPLQRYARASVIRAGANTAVGQIYCIRYGNRKPPLTPGDVHTLLVSPAAGAAV